MHLEGIMFSCTIKAAHPCNQPYIAHLHMCTYFILYVCGQCIIDWLHGHASSLAQNCTWVCMYSTCMCNSWIPVFGVHLCMPPQITPMAMAILVYTCTSVSMLLYICVGLQSQSETENATNTLWSLPSDDDNDNLPLVIQREESLKVKGEWSSFVSNSQREGNSKL